jgi:AraC family transcriptional regulator
MKILARGTYLGRQSDYLSYTNVIISKTEYREKADQDWHCHENSFFAYFLKGGNYEYRKAKEIKCSPGTLLYYGSMEPHCNKRYAQGSKIFHLEVDDNWFKDYDLPRTDIRADIIDNTIIKNAFINVVNEFAIRDELSGSSIQVLLVYLFHLLTRSSPGLNHIPTWVRKFNSAIEDAADQKLTLENVSKRLNIHPVTLSKEFSRYFHCSFGDYVRQRRIENALPLLAKKNLAVNEVAFQCGFSDTSNFIRTFKKVKGVTPAVYRQWI